MTSAESSGGISSSTERITPTTPASGSCSAVAISFEVTVTVRGMPLTWSRPRSCVRSASSTGSAEPMAIFRSSAVRSPMIRLWRRLT